MTRKLLPSRVRPVAISAVVAAAVLASCSFAFGQNNGSGPGSPFELTPQPNEHPLMPAIRALKMSQEVIDQNVRDYSCTLVKRERVDGQLSDYQYIFMKVAHDPFSVYLKFLKPFEGREVLYVDGQNDNKLTVLESGFKRYLGKISLDPEGALAMQGQKHPITRIGIRNLTAELLKMAEAEAQFGECDVSTDPDVKINDRSTTMFQIVHPVPRQNFRAHVVRVFFDNEWRVPIHYDSFLWPAQPGGQPPLEESYTYQNLKINNGYTSTDFDPNNNPEIFR